MANIGYRRGARMSRHSQRTGLPAALVTRKFCHMDADDFDRLTRSFTATPSRRHIARALAGLGLAGALGLRPGAASVSAKNKKRRKCKGGTKRCGKTCLPRAACCDHSDCPAGASCERGSCVCPGGEELCDGRCGPICLSTQVRNPVNCGCCTKNDLSCSPAGANPACCSGTCSATGMCVGRAVLQPCEFAAQCATGACSSTGLCLFATP